jgi:esterase/lipase superfamily enzyme
LQFGGAPILYSWPSRGTLIGYPADVDSVQWTAPHLEAFLEDVQKRSGATTVHLIAHSMGNRALLYALHEMALKKSDAHFGQVVLAAPDVARSLFLEQMPAIESMADHMTLYASSRDEALFSAELLNHYPRAGQSTDLTIVPPMETIDASAVDTGFMGHSYFGDNVIVLEDMVYLIRDRLPAAMRSHLKKSFLGTSIYWTFIPIPYETPHGGGGHR